MALRRRVGVARALMWLLWFGALCGRAEWGWAALA
jgi:hypothetical protein